MPERLRQVYDTIMPHNANPTVTDILLANWHIHYTDFLNIRPRGQITVVEYGSSMIEFFAEHHPDYLDVHPAGLNWSIDNRDYQSFSEMFEINLDMVHKFSKDVFYNWDKKGLKFPLFI